LNGFRLLLALLAGAGAGASPAIAASQATSTAPFKAAIVPLVAGSYASDCLKVVDHQPVGQGGPITILPGGTVGWAGHQVDVVHSAATDIGLVVAHLPDDHSVAALFDLADPQGGGRTQLIGVTVLADGNIAGATASDETLQPEQGSGCSSARLPPAVGANLWQLAGRFIHFEQMNVECIQLATFRQDKRAFTFTDQAILLGDLRIGANEPKASEHVEARDFADHAFSYSLARPDKGVLNVSINADRSLHEVQWITPDGAITGCKPPRPRG